MSQLDLYPGTYIDSDLQKKPRKKKPLTKKIIMNISDTQYAVVKYIGKKVMDWQLDYSPIDTLLFDICWTDNSVKPEMLAKMQPHQKINHFPGMSVLSRKNNLGKNLMKLKKEQPNEYNFFPMTFLLPNDYLQLKCYNMGKKQGKAQTFIVKPQASCQGRGIYLTRNIDKIKNQKCVVQRYLHKPFLLDQLKFDLRIYVLLTGLDPLRIFVHEEGLVRLATEPYVAPKSNNLQDVCMHLTNYAINKESPNFEKNQSEEKMNVGHKRSLTYLYNLLKQKGYDTDLLKKRINDLIIKTFISGHPTLAYNYKNCQQTNFRNNMCFQVLGFDIILDYKLNPILLEINYTPSFTTDTPLDSLIKKRVINDTLNLLNINQRTKLQYKADYDKQLKTRLMSAKRKRYTDQQRNCLIDKAAYKRDLYQLDNLGGFTRIYPVSQSQIDQYSRFFDLAYQLIDPSNVPYATNKYKRQECIGKMYYQPQFEIPMAPTKSCSKQVGGEKREKKKKVVRTRRGDEGENRREGEYDTLSCNPKSPKYKYNPSRSKGKDFKNSFYSTKEINNSRKEKQQKSKEGRREKSVEKGDKLRRAQKKFLEDQELHSSNLVMMNNYMLKSESVDSYLNKQ